MPLHPLEDTTKCLHICTFSTISFCFFSVANYFHSSTLPSGNNTLLVLLCMLFYAMPPLYLWCCCSLYMKHAYWIPLSFILASQQTFNNFATAPVFMINYSFPFFHRQDEAYALLGCFVVFLSFLAALLHRLLLCDAICTSHLLFH